MESRFVKYEENTQELKNNKMASHIANVNNFIDWLYKKGLDLIEKEIESLQSKIDEGNAPAIFSKKIKLLIALGKAIENVYEVYHFNKN